ncbi:unnamed protein product [Amoebophrya sp. A25]|nr:unnamed protein product [Amoebophrya sp. A25]|eukprot:GSA25T00001076001.1
MSKKSSDARLRDFMVSSENRNMGEKQGDTAAAESAPPAGGAVAAPGKNAKKQGGGKQKQENNGGAGASSGASGSSAAKNQNKQKPAAPVKITTHQAVLLADTTPSLVFNVLQLSAQHPMLLPIAGVPLIDHILQYVKEYNSFCERRYKEAMMANSGAVSNGTGSADEMAAFPQQMGELLVMTRSKKLKNHVENWERKNIDPTVDRIAFKVLVPVAGSADAENQVATPYAQQKQKLVGDVLSFLRDLHGRNVIQGDFLLWEPISLLSSPEILFEFFTQHLQTRQDRARNCSMSKLFSELPPASAETELFPLTHRGEIYLEKMEHGSSSATYEILHNNPQSKPQLDVIMANLLKRESRGCLEVLKNVVDLSIYIFTPDVLTKVANEAVDLTALSDIVNQMLVDKFESKLSSDSAYAHVTYKPVRSVCWPKSLAAVSKELCQKLSGAAKKKTAKGAAASLSSVVPIVEVARPEWFSGAALVAQSQRLTLQNVDAALNTVCIFSQKDNTQENVKTMTLPKSEELEVKGVVFAGISTVGPDSVLQESHFMDGCAIGNETFVEKSWLCDDVTLKKHASVNTGCLLGPQTAVPENAEISSGSIAFSSSAAFQGLACKEAGSGCVLLDTDRYRVSHIVENEMGCLSLPAAGTVAKNAAEQGAQNDEDDDCAAMEVFDAARWWTEYRDLRKFFEEVDDGDVDDDARDSNEDPFRRELRTLIEDFQTRFQDSSLFKDENNSKKRHQGEEEEDLDPPDEDDYNAALLELKSLRMASRKAVPDFAREIMQVVLAIIAGDLRKLQAAASGSSSAADDAVLKKTATKKQVDATVATVSRMGPFLANFTTKLESKTFLVAEIHERLFGDKGEADKDKAQESAPPRPSSAGAAPGTSPTLFVHILNAFRQFGEEDQIIDQKSIVEWHAEAISGLEQQRAVLENGNLKALVQWCLQDEDDDSDDSEDDDSD